MSVSQTAPGTQLPTEERNQAQGEARQQAPGGAPGARPFRRGPAMALVGLGLSLVVSIAATVMANRQRGRMFGQRMPRLVLVSMPFSSITITPILMGRRPRRRQRQARRFTRMLQRRVRR